MSPTPIMQDAPARRSHSDETPGSTMDIDEAPPAAGGGGPTMNDHSEVHFQALEAVVVCS